jgi:hypothetical protein
VPVPFRSAVEFARIYAVARPSTIFQSRGARSVAFWVGAVLLYAGVGSQLPQAVFLGFWQSIPYLLLVHWVHGRLFGRAAA